MAASGGDAFSAAVLRFGTDEPTERTETVAAGSLAVDLAGATVRYVRWHGHEVLRGIDFVIRDEHWGTYRPELRLRERISGPCGVRLVFAGSVADGALVFELAITADLGGRLDCIAVAEAKRHFCTNRTGFTVLHPIEGVAGAPVVIGHTDGSTEHGRFPERISPGQPFSDIAWIRHTPAPGLTVDCRFAGDVFEMEDQRNWTDASFKTYCRPLALPFPYTIAAGERVRQTVAVSLAGNAPARRLREHPTVMVGGPTGEAVPAIALALERGWEPPADAAALVAALGASSLLARVDLREDAVSDLGLAARVARAAGLPLELEIVTADDGDPAAALAAFAGAVKDMSIDLRSVMALPAAYLRSYQPTGPWPTGLTPTQVAAAARRAFPGFALGCGMLTNFAEFNRRPPEPPFDFATHGTCAIVHAADDQSVMETLECLPHLFASARALIGTAGYRLGLVAIGARTNPYGAKTADNPDQRRLPMARVDPRQRGLFAAAFALGAVGATAGFAVDRMALAAPAGPFGCIWSRTAWPQPGYDGLAKAGRTPVYPLWHALRWLGEAAGRPRLACRIDEPRRVAGVAWQAPDGPCLLLANLGGRQETVLLGDTVAEARLLDETSAIDAITDPTWSRTAPTQRVEGALALGPYAVARLALRSGR